MRTSYDRLSAHDAGYLTRETETQPLHYVVESQLAEPVSLDDVRQHVGARLASLPHLHRRLRYPLLKGRPVWVDDRDFSVERQVVAWDGPCATDEEVHQALVELTTRRLPRDRPLWRLSIGTSPGRTTSWLSVHHALMDGGLLARALAELFSPGEAPVASWQPRRGPSRTGLLAAGAIRKLRPAASPPPPPAPAASSEPTGARALAGAVGPTRTVASTTVPLEDLRGARARSGATVNDLFLAAVTTALREYLPDAPADLLALVPRDVRSEQEATAIGNRGWSMHVLLPVGVADADERLAAIKAATAAGKQLSSTAGALGWRFDVALTNVRLGGPHAMAGSAVRNHIASVPLQGQNRLVGTATSYDGLLTVTFTGEGEAFPDLDRLARLTGLAFQGMR